jgi:hypothetical protein
MVEEDSRRPVLYQDQEGDLNSIFKPNAGEYEGQSYDEIHEMGA